MNEREEVARGDGGDRERVEQTRTVEGRKRGGKANSKEEAELIELREGEEREGRRGKERIGKG